MGNNGNKELQEKKTHVGNHRKNSLITPRNDESDLQSTSKKELRKESEIPNQQHDKLKDPSDERPIELSWLQQNKSHDNYNRMSHPHHQHTKKHHHHHHHHHSHHHNHNPNHEHLSRPPLAINRRPKDDDQVEKQTKSFIEEYIRR
ncbi:unnamed protein product [Rotaria socialis]|uniref:Uncharacterized protein n=1 Tax=Rotaria socialis TaxID=392032 RepID=A0A820P029_9BILA|nr:unnamed protein product [Rotaria socialis]CAF4395455.1 unnamed protein product [Rotaria socialis]